MFRRILIANRGEIAVRVMRACRELGVETVLVYSEADRNAQYLRMADETICIGPAPSAKSYLDIPKIISAAEIADVEAIHPGYGFLSENAHFAEVCHACNIRFIGPPPEAIASFGDKQRARAIAKVAGVPTVPGSTGILATEEEALRVAREIGFPVILKAVAGGGGRGMRVAHNEVSLVNGLHQARAEAEAAFKNSGVYLEKFIERPRHVEIQVLGDGGGNLLYLGERDCSLQRRHQKLVEEAPSPVLTPEIRRRMGEAAVAVCRQTNYENAGTVEFLVDRNGNFYFIEVNARIQVEHPVTEMVTGIDLVQEQIRIAAGERLRWKQSDIQMKGCAIECRINAEDPDANFRPTPGRVTAWMAPGGPGVRLDTHVAAGAEIPPNYDSLVAKLIVHRPTRREAIATMRRCLSEFHVEGISTTIPFHRKVFEHADFLSGEVDTGFVERYFATR
ncbi:MAG: acetyl-CoA carboxylase biotin carboxylase subunit [Planctomycetes bacterium]|nr:acetyl-CoA carboxylase biotin carboxylase subunit [Planctomycetota bacterium]